ncbi:MAG: prolyl oligopeptidase family serine peptidase [Myxococcota bacterium]|nr:prolyl oligopeptidase family serine peptidase [Myxococcota bacterium]
MANSRSRFETIRRLSPLAVVLFATGLVGCTEPTAAQSSEPIPFAQPTELARAGDARRPSERAELQRAAADAIEVTPDATETRELVFPQRWESATEFPSSLRGGELRRWRRLAPEVEQIEVESTVDGEREPALFYDSGSERAKPLLVVLHSWSADHLQNIHIPYAQFAIENDWVFVHPRFRGPNRRAEATLSETAVQDVLDAVDHAVATANVDPSRIYLLGYSSGAMMSLVLAGRHPDRWAGVAAWVAVYDLAEWYREVAPKGSRYARDIVRACGGVPRPGSDAEEECRQRSPAGWLHHAAGRTPVLIAHGVGDRLASVEHALDAYDALAAPEDRFTDEQIREITRRRRVTPALREALHDGDSPHFEASGTPVVLRRTSRGATLVLFRGQHDMFYRPGLAWLNEQRRGG